MIEFVAKLLYWANTVKLIVPVAFVCSSSSMLMMDVPVMSEGRCLPVTANQHHLKSQKKHRRGKKRVNRPVHPYSQEQSKEENTTATCCNQKPVSNNGEIRPRYSPKAPRNYTQFIIGDQNDNIIQDDNEVAQNNNSVDFATYIQAQFEVDYKHARTAELSQKSKAELSDMIYHLESRESELLRSTKECSDCQISYYPMTDGDGCSDSDYDSSSSDGSSLSENTTETHTDLQNILYSLQREHQELLNEHQRLNV